MHAISRKERVQAFTFLAVGLLVIAGVCGFLIGVPLLKDTRQYFVRFHESVMSVDKGSDVRYRGVKSGRVKNLTIDYDEIQIELEVDPTLRVTDSTLARISAAGLLGPYFIELYGTTKESHDLPEGAVIRTDPSTMKTLVDKGTQTIDNLDAVLANLKRWTSPENEQKFARVLDEAAAAIKSIDETVKAIRPDAERTFKSYADASTELTNMLAENRQALNGMLEDGRKAAGELRRFLESGKLDDATVQASRTLESMRTDVNAAATSFTRTLDEAKVGERLAQITASLDRAEKSLSALTTALETEVLAVSRGEVAPALAAFREAMTTLNELVRTLRDDPSLVIFSRPRPEVQVPRPGNR